MNSKVSVIIPVYNVEKYLAECLDSVVNQTLKDIEIICINDGSTDNSGEILDEYAQKDNRIKIIHKKNEGAAVARNLGIKEATGDYILIVDADDIFKNDLCEKLYDNALSNDTDITICHSVEFDNNTNIDMESEWIIKDNWLPDKKIFNSSDMPKHIIGFCQGWSWDKLYKRSFVLDNNLEFQNLKCTNDMFFVMLSLVLAKRIMVLEDVLIRHRQNVNNSISNTRDKNPYCFIEAIYKLKEVLEEKGLYENIKQSFINWNVEFCFWHLDTLKLEKNKKKLAKKLKLEVFNKLNVYSLSQEYFYNLETYKRVHAKKIYKSNSWYQTIFSLTNETTHKVITVLGLKIKFKRRNKCQK